jgi:hypothetical protein
MNLYSFNFVQFTFLTITLILSHFLWFFDTFWQSGIFYFGYVPTEWYFLFLICSDSGIFYFWYVPTVTFFILICSDRVVFFIFDMFRQSGIFYMFRQWYFLFLIWSDRVVFFIFHFIYPFIFSRQIDCYCNSTFLT